jgi:hypothetical protein
MFKEFSKKWNHSITCHAKEHWDNTRTFGLDMTNRKNQLYISYKASGNLLNWFAYKITGVQYKIGLIFLRTQSRLICTERTVANCLAR